MHSDRLEMIRSEDGSHTVKSDRFAATYHSLHGAIQESQHIFIKHGLHTTSGSELTIFEMGFGTGLNAYLTLLESGKMNISVNYISLDKHPLSFDLYSKLNYSSFLGSSDKAFLTLHKADWNKKTRISEHFSLTKIQQDILSFEHSEQYHLVYYDAFAPSSQPGLWTEAVFVPLYNVMHQNAHLLTYCAKGVFKRMLRSIGFQVNSPQGPPGKREITQAIKVG